MNETWKTILSPAEGSFKEKGSRFLSYIYPVKEEDEIKEILASLRKEHHSARHHCFAWQLGTSPPRTRANDDGEPPSTAGKPILGQLISSGLTNVLLVVVRYFGGRLLGVPGLIHAYREAASSAVSNAETVEISSEKEYRLDFSFSELNTVMLIIKKEGYAVKKRDFSDRCLIEFSVSTAEAPKAETMLRAVYGVKITEICPSGEK